MLNVFARAAHAPEMAFRLDPKMLAMVPEPVMQSVERSKPIQNVFNQVLRDLQVPRSVLQFMNYPTRFDSSATQKLLDKAKIRVPAARGLRVAPVGLLGAPSRPGSLDRPQPAGARCKGKVVVITGGSSGIGEAAAMRIAEAGGKVVDRRARRGKARRRAQEDHGRGRLRQDLLVRHHRLRRERQAGEGHPQGVRAASTC